MYLQGRTALSLPFHDCMCPIPIWPTVPEVLEWRKTMALHSWLWPTACHLAFLASAAWLCKNPKSPYDMALMVNTHPTPQTRSCHVLSSRAFHLRRSAHWKDARATPVISDYTFVHILIQLLCPRFEEMVSENSLFSTLLCLILTYLLGCEQIQSLHRLLWVVWTLSLLLHPNHRHAVQDKV